MKEYKVTITETLQKTVSIEAESREEAERLIEDMWKNSEIILDSDDFYDVSYAVGKEKEIEKENMMEVLLVKPGQLAEMTVIKAGLSSMQEIVGGDIQAAYFFDEPVAVVCNEEGKMNGSELNRSVKDDNGMILSIIVGTFSSNIHTLMRSYLRNYSIAASLPWEEARHWKYISACCSNS